MRRVLGHAKALASSISLTTAPCRAAVSSAESAIAVSRLATKAPAKSTGHQASAQHGASSAYPGLIAATICERFLVVLPFPEKWELEWWERRDEIEKAREQQQTAAEDKRVAEELASRLKTSKKQEKKAKKAAAKEEPKAAAPKDADAKEGADAAAATPGRRVSKMFQVQTDDDVKDDNEDPFGFEGAEAPPNEQELDVITADDKANNRKSLYRALTKRLFLIVKKPGSQNEWQFPQGQHASEDGLSLRLTAEREFRGAGLGESLQVHFTGHCPMGFVDHAATGIPAPGLPSGIENPKTFFFRATYIDGLVEPDGKRAGDYLWVSREELREYLDPKLYEYVRQILPIERADGFAE